jgi:hypothetical protein
MKKKGLSTGPHKQPTASLVHKLTKLHVHYNENIAVPAFVEESPWPIMLGLPPAALQLALNIAAFEAAAFAAFTTDEGATRSPEY